MSIVVESAPVDHAAIPAAMRPTTKAPDRPVGPLPPAPTRSWTDRHALEFGPRWVNVDPVKVSSLTPEQRAFLAGWEPSGPGTETIPAAEMAELGAVEDAVIEPQSNRLQDRAGRPSGPSPEDVAWLHGYEGGRQGIDAAEPEDCSPAELIAWHAGRFVGETDRFNAARTARVLAEA